MHKIIFFPEKKSVPTLPKKFRPITRNTLIFFIWPYHSYYDMGLDTTKPVFGVSDKARLKPLSSATEIRLKIEISPVVRLDMILYKKGITKAMISLRLCCSQTPKTGYRTSRPIL